ncbi:MAG TPA: hypothetical protein PLF88_12325 [Opitutaceae bacterium]|mgnify:FL=1|nr:hypothetical protein [Opitutaceae bacterium]
MSTIRLLLLAVLLPCGLPAQSLTATAPVESLRLPLFTKDGHRSMLLIGSAAQIAANRIVLQEMTLTLFSGDDRNLVETVILSPTATVHPDREFVEGSGAVRVIGEEVEITGLDWNYDHAAKRVSIARNARVVFRAQLPDIFK